MANRDIYAGYIGRFARNRNIETNGFNGSITKYYNTLSLEKDFKLIEIAGNRKLVHEATISIYKSLYTVKLILIIDNPNNPKKKDIRSLISNLTTTSVDQLLYFYSLRWKEETYHQVIKDAFNSRTHKLRKLSSFSRYLEVLNAAYGLCEMRRHRKYQGKKTVFAIKNELLYLAKKQFLLNVRGNQVPKDKQDRLFKKFLP